MIDKFFKMADSSTLVLIAAVVIYAAYRYINYFFDVKKIHILPELQYHPLLSYMKFNIESKIPRISISKDEGRDLILKKFLLIKFQTFYDKFYNFSLRKDLSTLEKCELQKEMFDLTLDGINEYEMNCRKHNIPEIFIDKFGEWHEIHVNIVSNAIKTICTSDYHRTNREKIAVILQFFYTAFEQTILDAEKTLRVLNGDLTKWIKENPQVIESFKNNYDV